MNIDKCLLSSINSLDRNTLIIGAGGCGKSLLINQMFSTRSDIILTAPSGIAAQNINGRTIQSLFGITPRQYTGKESIKNIIGKYTITRLRNSNILLIDEISMLRCEILDIVDYKLKIWRENKLPFGGMKLLFLGDPCQMEPVTLPDEHIILDRLYKDIEGNYNFYNSNILRYNNFFDKSFDIFQINQDYRHKDDISFRKILKNVRLGKISSGELNTLNGRYSDKKNFDDNYQYLTVTNSTADKYNNYFFNKLHGETYNCPAILKIYNYYHRDIESIKTPFKINLDIKKDMKIIFVKNDIITNGHRWVNGTAGKICGIKYDSVSDTVISVSIKTKRDEYTVFRDTYDITAFDSLSNSYIKIGMIEQFPFIPAWAITIDKSQGLTLDKIAIVMEKHNRPNQMYVALSRARKLEDVFILERKIRKSDIHFSVTMKRFLDRINDRIIIVDNDNQINTAMIININNHGSVIINNCSENNISS
jgi:hypothetical protein